MYLKFVLAYLKIIIKCDKFVFKCIFLNGSAFVFLFMIKLLVILECTFKLMSLFFLVNRLRFFINI